MQVMRDSATSLTLSPADGCYIRGLYVEGARWDMAEFHLAESRPKELYTDMPVVWLQPVANRKPPTQGVYECPVYKTLTRAGQSNEDQSSLIKDGIVMASLPNSSCISKWRSRLHCRSDFA